MLVISVKKVPTTFNKIVSPYLYKMGSGLYVGDVTRKIYDYLLDYIPLHIGQGECIFIWKNGNSPTGFDVVGVGSSKIVDLDGLNMFLT